MRRECGSAVVQSVFGMFFVLLLALGAIQVALTLYARNVVMSAVHEGARAAVQIDGSASSARAIAYGVIERTAGNLVEDLRIDVQTSDFSDRHLITVRATGELVAPGPVPVNLPMNVEATTARESLDVSRR